MFEIQNFRPLAIFFACTAQFVSNLFKNTSLDFSCHGSNFPLSDSDKALSTTEGVIVNDSTTSAVLSGVLSEEALLGDNHQTVIILQGDLPNLNLGDATEQLLSGLKFGEISNQTGNRRGISLL